MILVHVQWPDVVAIDLDKREYVPMHRGYSIHQAAAAIAKLPDALISIDIANSPGLAVMHRLQAMDIPADRFIVWPVGEHRG